ncbi:hypothetical protein ACM66T_10245 [Sulfurimonas sp. ST-25]|uniref:hypothetical protein n=1 Tax=Sulfurimonas sp. ST-25 TaxID=3400151 RepID=UPI003A8885CD
MSNQIALKIKIDSDTKELLLTRTEVNKLGQEFNRTEDYATRFMKSITLGAGVVAGYYALKETVAQAIDNGVRFNAQLETMQIGIASLISVNSDNETQMGRTLSQQEKFRMAMASSSDVITMLKQANLETSATLEQLTQGFQSAVGPSLKAGMSLKQTVEYTKLMTQAAGAMGLPMDQLAQEMRSVVSGTIDANSVVAKNIGITNEQVKAARESGKLYELLTEKLSGFAAAGRQVSDSFEGSVSNMSDAWDGLTGELTKPIFDSAKNGANILANVFNDLTKSIHNSRLEVQRLQDVAKSKSIEDIKAQIAGIKAQLKNDHANAITAGISSFWEAAFGTSGGAEAKQKQLQAALAEAERKLKRLQEAGKDALKPLGDSAGDAAQSVNNLNGSVKSLGDTIEEELDYIVAEADRAYEALQKLQQDPELDQWGSQLSSAMNVITSGVDKINDKYMAMHDVVKDLFDENEMQRFYAAWQKEAEGSMEDVAQSGGWQDVWTENAAQTFTNAMQLALNGEFDVSNFTNNIANSIAQSLSKLGPEGAVAGALVQLYEPILKAVSNQIGGKSYEGGMIGTALAGLTGGLTGLGIGALFGGSGGSGVGLIGTNAGKMTVKSSGGASGDWGDIITADTLLRVMTAAYSESSVAGYTTGGKVSADWNNEKALQQVRGFFIAFDSMGAELAGIDPLEMASGFYKSVKKFNDALGKGMLESITGANADALYKEWQSYAKEQGVETIDAILGSLQTALTAQRYVDVYNAGSTTTEALGLLSEYAQADLERYAKSIGAEGVTLQTYNDLYDQMITTSPTPEMIDAWAQLAEMLIAADTAAQNYQQSLMATTTAVEEVVAADTSVQDSLVQFSDNMLSMVHDLTVPTVPLNNYTYTPTVSYQPAISVNATIDSETRTMMFNMSRDMNALRNQFRAVFDGTSQDGVALRTKAVV